MFRFHIQNDYVPALDAEDDRDLIAQMNEARTPSEIQSLTTMARHRVRARERQAAASRTRRTSARGTRHSLGRALSFRW